MGLGPLLPPWLPGALQEVALIKAMNLSLFSPHQLQSHLIPGLNLAAVGLFPASSNAVPPPPSSVSGAAPYSSFMVGAHQAAQTPPAACLGILLCAEDHHRIVLLCFA